MSALRLARRSTHGLESGRDGPDWRRSGYCARGDVDPELWFTSTEGARTKAAHFCRRHCPVLAQCHAEALAHPPADGVFAGIVWTDHRRDRRPAAYQPAPYRCGPWCRP